METINARMLQQMFLSGAATLESNKEKINDLNVFPVPDGDTGTNMTMTINSAADEVRCIENPTMDNLSKAISTGSLRGARGNSGVILSQLFRGFCKEIKEHEELDMKAIAVAMQKATETAYKAVMKPKEGTILTVARGIAEKTVEEAERTNNIAEAFENVLEHGEKVLASTPDMLPVLKQAGVVDSGGQGLLCVLYGCYDALTGKVSEFDITPATGDVASAATGAAFDDVDIEFGYCTEFIVRLEPSLIDKFSENQLKKELERIPGNSIVVVQDEDIVKVHVHTLKPGEALNLAQRFGEFVKLKIENMQEQANNLQNAAANQGSIVGVDDSKPQKREAKETAIISVCAGQGVEDAFLELHCDYVVSGGQTMNPSTEDMVAAVKEVNAKNVIILPNNSNIVMTAQQTATILEGEVNVIVIPTKTIPQGLSACVMYNPEVSLEDNIAEMEDAVSHVKTGQVTFAIKDTNIDGVEIKANDYMALVEKDIVACKPNKLDAVKVCLDKLVDEDSELITLLVGEDVVDEEVEEIESYIEDNFDAEVDIIEGKQPVYSFIIGVE